jgi:hypothetical protein
MDLAMQKSLPERLGAAFRAAFARPSSNAPAKTEVVPFVVAMTLE